MLGHSPYHFNLIRSYITVFGTLFNDVSINRTVSSSNTTVTQTLSVPIQYAAKESMLVRLRQDPNLDREAAIVLPRMSFELVDVQYDQDRKLNSIGRKVVKDSSNANKLRYQYNPVPFNFNFELNVYAKYRQDGPKIVEQIVPFFTPSFTPTLDLIEPMGLIVDTPVILNKVTPHDLYEGEFTARKMTVWTLNFTMKAYLWGPYRSSPIIKVSNTHFYFGNTADPSERVGSIRVTPGLLANGSPTTNAAASVNTSLIEVDDDFGYCIDLSNTGPVVFE